LLRTGLLFRYSIATIAMISSGARAFFGTLLVLTLAWAVSARADGISVISAELQPTDEGYVLDAAFDINFSPTLEDALNRGVVMTFLLEFELTRSRWYWLDEKIAQVENSWKFSYNALTRQYRLSVGSLYQNFDRFEDAKRVLSRVRSLSVADKGALKQGATYDAAVRLRLDVTKLPKPFQINALASREWNLSSEWQKFHFTP
jgi:hypothetical protein